MMGFFPHREAGGDGVCANGAIFSLMYEIAVSAAEHRSRGAADPCVRVTRPSDLNSSVIAKSCLASSGEKTAPVSVGVKGSLWPYGYCVCLPYMKRGKKNRCEVLQLVGSKPGARGGSRSLQERFNC